MRISTQNKQDDVKQAETKSKNAKKKLKKIAKSKITTSSDKSLTAIKIKQLSKEIKDFMKYIGLDEEKEINEAQPLGPYLQKIVDSKKSLPDKVNDVKITAMTPTNQVIEVYEKFLSGDLDTKFITAQQKFLNQKNMIEAIKHLFQVGADPELLYIEAPKWPEQNPLVRAQFILLIINKFRF
jgi:hypothetical protein